MGNVSCLFCSRKANSDMWIDRTIWRYDCDSCGMYNVHDDIVIHANLTVEERVSMAAILEERKLNNQTEIIILREMPRDTKEFSESIRRPIFVATIQNILDEFPKTPIDRLNRTLLKLYKFNKVEITEANCPTFFATSKQEMEDIIGALEKRGYVKIEPEGKFIRITYDGKIQCEQYIEQMKPAEEKRILGFAEKKL